MRDSNPSFVGISFSISGTLGKPRVKRVGAVAIAGAVMRTIQSAVTLPVQLLGAPGAGDAARAHPRRHDLRYP